MNYREQEDDLDGRENWDDYDYRRESFVVFVLLVMAIGYLIWIN